MHRTRPPPARTDAVLSPVPTSAGRDRRLRYRSAGQPEAGDGVARYPSESCRGFGGRPDPAIYCDDRQARIAAVTFTLVQIVVRSLLWLAIGVALLVVFPFDATAPVTENLIGQRELLFVRGIDELLPAGLRGLMLTGMLAALAEVPGQLAGSIGNLFLAGDYMGIPSVNGALSSGHKAATQAADLLAAGGG